MKKLLWGLSVLSSVVTLPLIAASCGKSKYTHPNAPKVPVANIKLNEDLKLTADEAKNLPYKYIMITDGAALNDKSFNQSTWEGLLHFAELQNKLPRDKFGTVFNIKWQILVKNHYNIIISGF
ncbi:Hypothetical protein, predicted lipoprotein [Metamycoplasma auris 15026]|uniref:Uncharacterized protein n=1 Tax=Metamycoplasma auris 15026 TaxID=1188233 RepID=N9TSM7_9BACT|nr:variable surface lipoprotein [Metamycoplasma auris]ENY69149.1 Hypothetical protein, predicted lipoprotein [Metamycoplasma auris 15026]